MSSYSSFFSTSLFNLKERVSVLERLQPSLATITQDLKEGKLNKGKYTFIIKGFIQDVRPKEGTGGFF